MKEASNTESISHWPGFTIIATERVEMEDRVKSRRSSPGPGWRVWLWHHGKVWGNSVAVNVLGLLLVPVKDRDRVPTSPDHDTQTIASS